MNSVAEFQTFSEGSTITSTLLKKIQMNIVIGVATESGNVNLYNVNNPEIPKIQIIDPSLTAISSIEYLPTFSSLLSEIGRAHV